ncbi:MAG: hypothetical protein QXM75_03380 [Candidatus Diapherotrites archaeon]
MLGFFDLDRKGKDSNNNITPTPSLSPAVDRNNYFLKYSFDQNLALFHYLKIETKIGDDKKTMQEMETMTIPMQTYPDHTHIRIIMLKASSTDENGTVDLCGQIAYSKKISDANIYFDGKVDYGWTSVTSFYLPQRALSIGETWTFEGVNYKIIKETKINTKAGVFDVVEIEFYGKKTVQEVVLDTKGTLYFDYKNNRIAKYVRTESAPGYEQTIEQELTKVTKDHIEPDLRCLVSISNLSLAEKYEKAKNFNTYGLYEESNIYALSAKFDLQGKELSADEKNILMKILEIIANNYEATGNNEKRLDTLFELGNLYLQSYEKAVVDGNINARDYFFAKYYLEEVSKSTNKNSEKAKQATQKLGGSVLGILKAEIILADSGDCTGVVSELHDTKKIVYLLHDWDCEATLPMVGDKRGDLVAFYVYKNGYKPAILIRATEQLLSKDLKFVLDRAVDDSKAIVFGICYKEDNFLNGLKLVFEGKTENIEIDCNYFYKTEVPPGEYKIFIDGTSTYETISVDANRVYVKHINIK